MPNGFTGYGQYADPISMDNSAGQGLDPIGLGMPSATAPIGTGVTPQPDPAQAAAAMEAPVSGAPMMPVLPPPTTSQKLISAGLAMIQADQQGAALGGSLGAGMQAYNDQLTGTSEKALKARQMQLQEYEIMGRIADRHNTELAMQRKVTAGQKIKAQFPQYADLYDADPAEALKMIAQKYPNGVPDQNAVDNSTMTGQDYLDSLKDPRRAAQIQAWATGKYPINKRAKTYNQDMQDVLAFDPNANEQTLKVRGDTAQDFSTKGASGKILTSVDTAASHLADLKEAYADLHNGTWNGANFIKNEWAGTHAGPTHAALNKAKLAIDTIAPELDRIASGTDPTVSGTKSRHDKFNLNDDPASFSASLNEAGSLIKGKTDSLLENYQRIMGQKVAPDTIKPFSDRVINHFKDLGIDLSDVNDKLTPEKAAAAAASAAPVTAPAQAPLIQSPTTTAGLTPPAAPPATPDAPAQAGGGILDEPVAQPAPLVPAAAPIKATPTRQQLEYTAKKHGMTVEQVKAKLGIK